MTNSQFGITMPSKNTAYADQRFTAETNPTTLWMELLKNCTEAVMSMLERVSSLTLPQKIKIRCMDLEKGLPYPNFYETIYKRKISFLNPGGMIRKDLHDACQFNSSVGKDTGEDFHQGVGARASSLAWTDLMWITYKHGVAHMVVMGERTIKGQRRLCYLMEPGESHIQDCTVWVKENAEARGYDLSENAEWTETIVLGRHENGEQGSPTQNMATHPYGVNEPKEKQGWLPEQLLYDVHRLPKQVQVLFEQGDYPLWYSQGKIDEDTGQSKFGSDRYFKTYDEIFWEKKNSTTTPEECRNSAQYMVIDECEVLLDDNGEPTDDLSDRTTGNKIHFYYDPPKDIDATNGARDPMTYRGGSGNPNFGALVWKSPDHPISQYWTSKVHQSWQYVMQKLGILRKKDARYFKIFFELGTGNATRTRSSSHLVYKNTSVKTKTTKIELDHFLASIYTHRPEFIRDAIRLLNSKVEQKSNIDQLIKDALEFYKDTEKFNRIFGDNSSGSSSMEEFYTKRTKSKNTNPNPNPNPKPKPGPWTPHHSNDDPVDPNYTGPKQKKWKRQKKDDDIFENMIYPQFQEVSTIDGEKRDFASYIEQADPKAKPIIEYIPEHSQVRIMEKLVEERLEGVNAEDHKEEIRGAILDNLKVILAVDTILVVSKFKQDSINDETKARLLSNEALTKLTYNYEPIVMKSVQQATFEIKQNKKLEKENNAAVAKQVASAEKVKEAVASGNVVAPTIATKPNTDNEYGISENLAKIIKHEMDY